MSSNVDKVNKNRSILGVPAILAAAILGYGTSFDWLIPIWLDQTSHYSHGFIVIALVGYRLWADRRFIKGEGLNLSSLILISSATLCASVAWLFGELAGIRVPGVFAALTLLWLALSVPAGRGGFWRLSPYFALLFTIIPFWSRILNPPLQNIASTVVNTVLKLFNLTIFVDGNTIFMPEIVFEIVGGCSGLGYVLVAFTLAVYLALDARLSLLRAGVLVTVLVSLAIISNWLRITSIMLVGYFEGPTHPLVYDHVWFGWVVFAIVFIPVLWSLSKRLTNTSLASPKREANTRGQGAILWIISLMLLMPILNILLTIGSYRIPEPKWLSPVTISKVQEPWDPEFWQPHYPYAAADKMSFFEIESHEVALYQAYYPNQRDGIEPVDSTNNLGGTRWLPTSQASTVIKSPNAFGVSATIFSSSTGTGNMLVWHWYRIGRTHASTNVEAKVMQVFQKLLLRPDAMLSALAVRCVDADCNEADKTLSEFLAKITSP